MEKLYCLVNRFLLTGALLVSGCVSNNLSYQPDPKHPIRTVALRQEIKMPSQMLFFGFSEMWLAGLGGAVGGGAGYAMTAESASKRAATETYDVPQSLRVAVLEELNRVGGVKVVSSGPADAELQIDVEGYGFYQAGVMSRRVRPIIVANVQLVRRDGTVVVKKRVGDDFKAPGVLPEKIRNDRQVGVAEMRVPARVVAKRIAEAFKPGTPGT